MAALQDPANELLLSAATIWELAIKVGQGKLVLAMPYRQWIEEGDCRPEARNSADHGRVRGAAIRSSAPPQRPLRSAPVIAQAVDGIAVVAADVAFDPYGVIRIW